LPVCQNFSVALLAKLLITIVIITIFVMNVNHYGTTKTDKA